MSNHTSPRQNLSVVRKLGRHIDERLDQGFDRLRKDISSIKRRQRRNRRILLAITFAFAGLWIWNPLKQMLFQAEVVEPKLIPVGRSSTETLADSSRKIIIFVHGLGGNSKTTFRNEQNKFWWDLAAKDKGFNDFELVAFDYGSNAFAENVVFNQAVTVLRDYIDEQCKDRARIVIISHSLGGLISRLALSRTNIEENKNQLVTFISLGTPFDGSGLANAARYLGNLTSRTVRVLETNNMLSTLARDDWLAFRERAGSRIIQFAGYEKKRTALFKVVPMQSAILDVPASRTHGFDVDHFGLVSPPDEFAETFQVVRSWILEQTVRKFDFERLNAKLAPGSKYVVERGEYSYEGDFPIPPGVTLELQAGTTLKLNGVLKVEGVLLAEGTPEEPVTIQFTAGENEGSIYFSGPHTNGSKLTNCLIRDGSGVSIVKPDPSFHRALDYGSGSDWHIYVKREKTKSRLGGGCLLVNADELKFENVEFQNCHAYSGGAVYCLGAARESFKNCRFTSNSSSYGGGAVFLQQSEAYFNNCVFSDNSTGGEEEVEISRYACGGALYCGTSSQVQLSKSCLFAGNRAAYVGGALYMGNEVTDRLTKALVATSSFVENHAQGEHGGAIYADDAVRLNVTDCLFSGNSAKPTGKSSIRGQSLLDATDDYTFFGCGVNVNGKNEFYHTTDFTKLLSPTEVAHATNVQNAQEIAVARKDRQFVTYNYYRSPIAPECYRDVKPGEPRKIDAIVIHHVSAINWDTDKGIDKNARIDDETMPGPKSSSEPRYDWRRCKSIFEQYGVSSHYLITREGDIIQLVEDEDVAFHAGVSKMPAPDGRQSANEFSLGIELISSHPDDDPTVVSEGDAYTEEQYSALNMLLLSLVKKYDISLSSIVGHDEVAPQRKKDPGPLFQWTAVFERLKKVFHLEAR